VTAPQTCSRQRKPLDAGGFQPEISSFRLHLAAEGKSAKTVRTYTEAVQWFAAGYQGRQGARRQDRPRRGPQPRPVRPRPGPARSGQPAGATVSGSSPQLDEAPWLLGSPE
jgi:hypothetical protein